MRDVYASAGLEESVVRLLDERYAFIKSEMMPLTVAKGEALIAEAKREENKGKPASMYKNRGQWVASLISSGAIIGWETTVCDSAEGEYLDFRKAELAEDGSSDGMTVQEAELKTYHEESTPMQWGVPAWDTFDTGYPGAFASPDQRVIKIPTNTISDDDLNHSEDQPVFSAFQPAFQPRLEIPRSILAQHMRAERTKLADGRFRMKVLFQNYLVDGTTVDKEIVNDPCKVLEEGHKVRTSIAENQDAIESALQESSFAVNEMQLKEFQEESQAE